MSNIKTNDATIRSAGALATNGTNSADQTNPKLEIKALLNEIKARKKDLNNQIKECDREEKQLQKQLTSSKSKTSGSRTGATKGKTAKKSRKSGKK
jgi:hypothetical protein